MKKLRVAIIGQGRSGRNIHGAYFLSELNEKFEVVACVDEIPLRRLVAEGVIPVAKPSQITRNFSLSRMKSTSLLMPAILNATMKFPRTFFLTV